MKAIIYGRAHRNDRKLAVQMEKMRNYCLDNGYEFVREVIDCCSGSQIGDNLISLIREPVKEYDTIIVQDPSRISRELVKMVGAVRMMRSNGIRLLFTEMKELNDPGKRCLN